jgi:hypothetical protein
MRVTGRNATLRVVQRNCSVVRIVPLVLEPGRNRVPELVPMDVDEAAVALQLSHKWDKMGSAAISFGRLSLLDKN